MSQSIKLDGNNFIDASGVWDSNKNKLQSAINSGILRTFSLEGTTVTRINFIVSNASRAGYLVYLGGSSGSAASLYFMNVYNAGEYLVFPIREGDYTLSQITGTTNVSVGGAPDSAFVVAISAYSQQYGNVTFN